MNAVDDIVDFIASRLSTFDKYDLKKDSKELRKWYEKDIAAIKDVYTKVGYWHGTGRYHYKHLGESKYHSEYSDETYDVLDSIIQHNGLTPQYDFWTELTSISLTKNRIYARAYSEFHQNEKEPLKYTFGSTKFWYFVLAIKQAFTNDSLHNVKRLRNLNKDKVFTQRFQQWGRYVKKDTNKPLINVFNFYKLRSDIPDNYGILFGIKKDGIEKISYNRTVERYESRCIKPISFEQMTHIEVPQNNLDETQKLLVNNGIHIPVLPLEITEIYCSKLGFNNFK